MAGINLTKVPQHVGDAYKAPANKPHTDLHDDTVDAVLELAAAMPTALSDLQGVDFTTQPATGQRQLLVRNPTSGKVELGTDVDPGAGLVPAAALGAPNGVATLGPDGLLDSDQRPDTIAASLANRITTLETGAATAVQSAAVNKIIVSTDPNVTLANGQLGIILGSSYQTYFTNFSEYAAGVAPSGWTPRWITSVGWTVETSAASGVTGGKVLQLNAGSGRRGLSWDQIDSDPKRDDLEIVFKHKVAAASGAGWPSAMFRASGAAGAETGYVAGIGYASAGGQAFTNITRFSNGTNTEHHTNMTLPTNSWYVTRVRAVDNVIQARTWAYGSLEPNSWDNTEPVASSDIVAAGWVGLWSHGLVAEAKHFDWIGVATSGGTAPVGS